MSSLGVELALSHGDSTSDADFPDMSSWGLEPQFSARVEGRACYALMHHVGERPSVTHDMVKGMTAFGQRLQGLRDAFPGREFPLRYFVLGANPANPFNLGGDLSLFCDKVEAGDRETLSEYARGAADVIYWHYRRYDLPIITIAVVQGDALGGGLEMLLAHDIVIVEDHARFGLPERVFNLFPGMGAYSFLSRRIGPVPAREMILDGRTKTAREMLEMGLVHHVVPQGTGYEYLKGLLKDVDRRFASYRAVLDLDRRTDPVTREELRDIVDVWVDTAFRLSAADLRIMRKIVTRQAAGRGDLAAAGALG